MSKRLFPLKVNSQSFGKLVIGVTSEISLFDNCSLVKSIKELNGERSKTLLDDKSNSVKSVNSDKQDKSTIALLPKSKLVKLLRSDSFEISFILLQHKFKEVRDLRLDKKFTVVKLVEAISNTSSFVKLETIEGVTSLFHPKSRLVKLVKEDTME